MDLILRYEHVVPVLFGVLLLLGGFGVLGKKPRVRSRKLIVVGGLIFAIHGLILLSRLLGGG